MKKFALILMMVAVLVVPATAIASSDGYTNVAGINQGGGPDGTSTPAAVAGTSNPSGDGLLPFTGLELGLMFGASVVLLGSGILLRRTRAR